MKLGWETGRLGDWEGTGRLEGLYQGGSGAVYVC